MLESLSRQSYRGEWEVVVSDNGSSDDTRGIAQSYSARLPRVVVVDASEHPGPAYARNVGVRRSLGEKILFLDADDEVDEGYVEAMAAGLENADFVCARIGFERLNPPWVREIWPAPWQQEGPLDDFRFLPFAGSGTLGIRRSLFDEVGGFRDGGPPSQFEECDLSWRIQLAGHDGPVLVPKAILHYRLPSSLKAMYRRGHNYTRGQLALYELYGDQGMPRPRRVSFRDVAGSLRRVRRKRDLFRTAGVLARLVGQHRGPPVADLSS